MHNGYLELVLLNNTHGFHYKDDQSWEVKVPCVLVIQKDDIHNWDLTSPVEGYVLIGTHSIKEAKRLLLYTDNTTAELGFKLGFSDKSNFSKFFKRNAGINPSHFKTSVVSNQNEML